MIITGYLVLPDLGGSNAVTIQQGWIETDGPFIVRIELGEIHKNADLGGENALISPGLIDVHAHLPQVDAMGAYGMELLDWLEKVVFPAEANWADPDYARSRSRKALNQFIASGTTGLFAFSANFMDATRAALEEVTALGIRAKIGQPLADIHIPKSLRKSTRENLEDLEELLSKFPEATSKRVAAAIAPRFALTCSEDLLAHCGQLAKETGAFVETHLAEMLPECERACEIHQAPDYTSIYEKAGLVTERSFLGHGIYLSDEEQTRIGSAGACIAHCPTSNTFLRSGTMNRARYVERGIRVGVASDIAGGPDRSMIRVARAMIEASFHADKSQPASSLEAWWHITQGNASLMGWQDAGILHEGAGADIIVIEADPDWIKAHDPLGYILFSWNERWLKNTIVRGQVAYSG